MDVRGRLLIVFEKSYMFYLDTNIDEDIIQNGMFI